jgi:predicted nucleic acid-binding protein
VLLTDTTILLRCSLGLAMRRVDRLRKEGIELATTDRNVEELIGKLFSNENVGEGLVEQEAFRVLEAFNIVLVEEYESMRAHAEARLDAGGKKDWPLLAAALATDGEIWSDDRDFFGVGAPVWSTPNVHLVEAAE